MAMQAEFRRFLALTLGLILVALAGTWLFGGFEGISGHGVAALIAGVVVSVAVAVGLMSLLFASSRHHDDAAHEASRKQFDDGRDRPDSS
jgi:hypothetical protein